MRLSQLGKIGLFTSLFTGPLVGCAGDQASFEPSETNAVIQLGNIGLSTTTVGGILTANPAPSITVTGDIMGLVAVAIGSQDAVKPVFTLTDANQKRYPLVLTDAQMSQLGLGRGGNAKGVTVSGTLLDKTITAGQVATPTNFIKLPLQPAGVTGTKRFATFYFKMPGQPFEPFQPSEASVYFDALFNTTAPGLRDYFSQASGGALTFDSTGFDVFTFDLEGELEPYFTNGQISDLTGLILKCAEIIGGAVNLPDYDGVNFAFNKDFGYSDGIHQFYFAAPIHLPNNGQDKVYNLTILPPSAFRSQAITAQAIALSFGLVRTGSSPARLDSSWDLLSSGGRCAVPNPSFSCVGVMPNTETRIRAGWAPFWNVANATSGYQEFVIDPPNTSLDINNIHPILGRVALPNGQHYTLEYRAPSSTSIYENELPGSGLVVHTYDNNPSGVYAGTFVDANHNGDPNDVGSAFTPGGTSELVDTANKIVIRAIRYEGNGLRIGVANQTVTVNVSPPSHGRIEGAGIKCGQTFTQCAATVAVAAPLTFTAYASAGYRFSGWGGCYGSSTTCSVTAKSNLSISATFSLPPPPPDDDDPLPPVCKVKPYLPQCNGQVP